jgi:hypothetical protein
MKIKILILILYFQIPALLFSQTKKNQLDTIKVGLYVNSIRNIDFNNSSFFADIWVSFTYSKVLDTTAKTKGEYPESVLEWPDAIDANNGGQPNYKLADAVYLDSITWKSIKVSTPFRKKWDLTNYPFDVQNISIICEASKFMLNEQVLYPLKGEIDSSFKANEKEYDIKIKEFKSSVGKYPTSFGNPNDPNGRSDFSNVILSFELKRHNRWITFMKLFTGILISFLLSLSVFFIKSTNLDARFGLCVGALFSAIGSKYIVDSMIPVNYQNTLFDYIHNVTFAYIFIITIISIISLKCLESDDFKLHKISKQLDKIGFLTCLTSYMLIVFIMVIDASFNISKGLIITGYLSYSFITSFLLFRSYKKNKI